MAPKRKDVSNICAVSPALMRNMIDFSEIEDIVAGQANLPSKSSAPQASGSGTSGLTQAHLMSDLAATPAELAATEEGQYAAALCVFTSELACLRLVFSPSFNFNVDHPITKTQLKNYAFNSTGKPTNLDIGKAMGKEIKQNASRASLIQVDRNLDALFVLGGVTYGADGKVESYHCLSPSIIAAVCPTDLGTGSNSLHNALKPACTWQLIQFSSTR